MRISELASRSGVSVPTIKYYLRTGLLAAGHPTAHNQAHYDESHLRRVRLIRVFVDVGGLTVLATREMLAAIDERRLSGERLLAVLDSTRAAARRRTLEGDLRTAAVRDVSALVSGRGWRVRPGSRAMQRLTDACVAARLLKMRELCAVLDAYAKAAACAAECDAVVARALAERVGVAPDQQRAALAEAVVVAAVLGNALTASLHAMAREDALTRLFAEWDG